MSTRCPECEVLKAERDEEQRLRRYWDKRFDETNAAYQGAVTECSKLNVGLVMVLKERDTLLTENAALKETIRYCDGVFTTIATPRGIETDGSGSAEEFEELYDFWHYASIEKFNLAAEASKRIKGETG